MVGLAPAVAIRTRLKNQHPFNTSVCVRKQHAAAYICIAIKIICQIVFILMKFVTDDAVIYFVNVTIVIMHK